MRKSLILFLLLAFLLSWAKDGLACLCFNVPDDHHETSLTLMHGEIHLVLHHPEDQQDQVCEPPDNAHTITNLGGEHSSCHIIHIQDAASRSKAKETSRNGYTLKVPSTNPVPALFIYVKSSRLPAGESRHLKPSLTHLFTTVLLI